MLTNEELAHLEDDLIAFLIVNGIDGAEWEKINQNEPNKAIKLVEIFSDQVLDSVYSKIEYLELRTPQTCSFFRFTNEWGFLFVLERMEESSIDLSSPEGIQHALVNEFIQLNLYKSRKSITDKQQEIHRLITQGALISTKEMWDNLESISS